MLVIAAFWLLLVLPGFALLRRLRCPWLAYGLPSSITLSYLTTFVLLSPVSLLGYIFHWPLWTLSAAVVLSVLAAAAWLVLRERHALRPKRPPWYAILLTLLILADAVLGLRSGTHTAGDATYHIARVRMLIDFGLNNWDPLVPGHRFDTIYHTNLYHALLAVSAQLSGRNAPDAWVYSWMFAKLATVGATYFLSFVIFRRRWLAWSAAGMACLSLAAYSVMPYPNTLAAYLLLPMAIGLGIEALTRRSLLPAWGFAGLALLSVQIHGLYYVLWCSLLAPALGLRLLYLVLRRRPGRARLFACLLAFGFGLPWFAVTFAHRAPGASMQASPPAGPNGAEGESAAGAESDAAAEPADAPVALEGLDRGFLRLRSGLLMLDPSRLWNVADTHGQLVLAIAVGLCSRRRRQFLALGGIILTLLSILYVPALCTFFVKHAGAPWIVKRFVIAHDVAHFAVCPAVYFSLVPLRFAGTFVRVIAIGAALAHGWVDGINGRPWTRKGHISRALHRGRASFVGQHARDRELFQRAIARESIVIAQPGFGVSSLVLDCACYPLALPTLLRGVSDMEQRRIDLQALMDTELDLPARRALLRHYGARYVILQKGARGTSSLRRIYKPITAKSRSREKTTVLELDLERPLPPPETPEAPANPETPDTP